MYQAQLLLCWDIPTPAAQSLTLQNMAGFLKWESQQSLTCLVTDWSSTLGKGWVTRDPGPCLMTPNVWFMVAKQTITHSWCGQGSVLCCFLAGSCSGKRATLQAAMLWNGIYNAMMAAAPDAALRSKGTSKPTLPWLPRRYLQGSQLKHRAWEGSRI